MKIASMNDDAACSIRVVHQAVVEDARKRAIPQQQLQRLALIYQVLGDPNRLKMILALKDLEMCVCDLAAFLSLTESAVSHQLRRMKDLGLVKKRRDGQVLYYALDDHHIAEILELSLAHFKDALEAV